MYFKNVTPRMEADRRSLEQDLLRAVEPGATKYMRVKTLMRAAPEPSVHSLQKRLFDLLKDDDLSLAVDIIVDGYEDGTVAVDFLQDCIDKINDHKQLRKVVGVLAAGAREDFSRDMFDERNFVAVEQFLMVAAAMRRLTELPQYISDVMDLAMTILSEIATAPGVELVPSELLSNLNLAMRHVVTSATILPLRPPAKLPASIGAARDPE